MTITALLPITGKSHWYVSAYIGVCVLSPLLNQALQNLNKKALTLCLLAIFLLFSVIPSILSFVSGDPYGLGDGYSMIWLSLLYLLGGYLRKYDILQKIKSSRAWQMYTMSICFTFVCNVFLQYATTALFGEQKLENFMRSYISPTIIIAALGLFVACARLRIPQRTEKVISFVSRAAFGVYLIHVCPPIWENVIMGMTASFAQYNTFALIACVFGTAVVIYFLCTLIELCRIYLFKKCRIDRIAIKVEQAISKKIGKMKWLNIEEEETAVQEQAM